MPATSLLIFTKAVFFFLLLFVVVAAAATAASATAAASSDLLPERFVIFHCVGSELLPDRSVMALGWFGLTARPVCDCTGLVRTYCQTGL